MELTRLSGGLWMVLVAAAAHIQPSLLSLTITRHHQGDLFLAQGGSCYKDMCVGLSSGTAGSVDVAGCGCQCMPNLPVFRDDLNICVDDIHECTLAPFVSGTTTQKIPFVFLPLKGQIVYPSAEITFSDVSSPICVVSGAQFLARGGWLDLRNASDTEPPFRLFRDENRTYLQWLGEGDLRSAMEGRLILVHLMCKDATETQQHRILTPCVAFRVAGNPSVREVVFSNDVNSRSTEEPTSGLSVSEYVAIGVCSVLLGLIYVASIFLYLHIRKKRRKNKDKDAESTHLTVEEGVVKNNPLLQPGRRHHASNNSGLDNDGYSSDSVSCCSHSDVHSDLDTLDEPTDSCQQNMQISAMVHPCEVERSQRENQDSFDRLPEEDVSIVEDMEDRDQQPESVHAMGGANIRRKLYFNPAYFEPDLLKTPPPAAIEFLMKIREVISVAKHKMSAKRFSPSLIGIPEEDLYNRVDKVIMRSRASSVTSLKSTTESRKNAKTCPGCADPPLATNFNTAASGACCPTDTKQRIIRKWLEDVPTVGNENVVKVTPQALKEMKESGNEIANKFEIPKRPSPPPPPPTRAEIKRPSVKGPAPPRPPPPNPGKVIKQEPPIEAKPELANFSKTPFLATFKGRMASDVPPPIPTSNPGPLPSTNEITAPSPPPLPKENADFTPRIQGKDKVPPAIAKTLMDAVIKELVVQKNIDPKKQIIALKKKSNCVTDDDIEYDFDSLERSTQSEVEGETQQTLRLLQENGKSDDYDDQIDSFINTCDEDRDGQSQQVPDVVQQHKPPCQDDHDYEVILLNPDMVPQLEDKELKIYNLPEILSKNQGYSLVSEVYVNDGYSYSSGEVSPNSTSQSSNDSLKSHPGRLTILVKDSPENYKRIADETATFEPDTLDRKPGKLKIVDNITNWEDSAQEKYSNQRFHGMDMEMQCQHQNKKNQYLNNDTFMDSLERPQILVKPKSAFDKASIEKHVDDLLRSLDSPLAKDFSSLREIYEAKSKTQKKRTETTSLVGSQTSDTDCMSTLSWNEDRRNKLLHRGIVLHMGSGKKQRRPKVNGNETNYPDVVPPRPPKPTSLTATPQRSASNTPAARSYCPSPANRSVCPSPNRSACTSPPPRNCLSPTRTCPTPPPPPRTCPTPPPPPPPRSTPPASPIPRSPAPATPIRSKCTSPVPTLTSAQTSPPNRSRSHSGRASPCASPNRSICASPITVSRSVCTSPSPPPRPSSKPTNNSPPLPPRNLKPPLPPKNAKSTRQKKGGVGVGNSSNLARRPLPPLPSRTYHDTLSSVSSRDLETLSTLSGASMDSLNSSDYEAFYTLPYDGNEGEIYDKAQEKFQRAQLEKMREYKNFPITNSNSEYVFSTDEDIYNAINMSSSFREKVKDLRTRSKRQDNRKWKPLGPFMHRPEDSGYLSTDSNESGLRSAIPTVPRIPERAETPSQGSETEGSNDGDGASESGAESTATDSFFFGKFRKDDHLFRNSFRLSDVEVNSDTERHTIPIIVRN